jgi:hypothetical protein
MKITYMGQIAKEKEGKNVNDGRRGKWLNLRDSNPAVVSEIEMYMGK